MLYSGRENNKGETMKAKIRNPTYVFKAQGKKVGINKARDENACRGNLAGRIIWDGTVYFEIKEIKKEK